VRVRWFGCFHLESTSGSERSPDKCGNFTLEFALNGVNGSVIAVSKHSIIGVDGPGFIMGAMSYTMPKENAEAAINVALKNCVWCCPFLPIAPYALAT
jgi:hypothetical protein